VDNLIKFLARYHFVIIFLFLEGFSIYLLVGNNNYKKEKFLNSSGEVSGFFYDNINVFKQYLSLKEANNMLAQENAKYLNSMKMYFKSFIVTKEEVQDTLYHQQYYFIAGKVINNSINKKHNYLTIDKGSKQGIKKDMAVISPKGVIGIVRDVTDNYCSVVSVLNIKLGISGKVKKSHYFGSLAWDGKNFQIVRFDEIPSYVPISRGDTVVTSGLSTVFPEGIPIGTIEKYEKRPGRNFWEIWVKLSVDFKNLTHVNIVGNLLREEQILLESKQEND
jgi:rod shape-determining protein MreC